MNYRSMTAATAGAFLVLSLSGCGNTTTSSSSSSASTQASALTLTDGWVKAVPAGENMTAAFGTIKNESDKEITITSASSPIAPSVQLHQTTKDSAGQSQMQENKDGIKIPAHGEHTLEPGGDHIMLMNLSKGVNAGDEVALTLKTSDGQETTVNVPAKEFSGANENYSDSASSSAHSTH
ncbi:MAG: copper chaperone PCu(A)C [Micrococcaceae bacterium]